MTWLFVAVFVIGYLAMFRWFIGWALGGDGKIYLGDFIGASIFGLIISLGWAPFFLGRFIYSMWVRFGPADDATLQTLFHAIFPEPKPLESRKERHHRLLVEREEELARRERWVEEREKELA